jgi:hypothetical protein
MVKRKILRICNIITKKMLSSKIIRAIPFGQHYRKSENKTQQSDPCSATSLQNETVKAKQEMKLPDFF